MRGSARTQDAAHLGRSLRRITGLYSAGKPKASCSNGGSLASNWHKAAAPATKLVQEYHYSAQHSSMAMAGSFFPYLTSREHTCH